jgi:hypothetical protein
LSTEQLQQGQKQLLYQNGDSKTDTNTTSRPLFRRRRIVDLASVADVEEARNLLARGISVSYPATIDNTPRYILTRRE